jgi:predicted enzyme related to lactoylglutathione lyase
MSEAPSAAGEAVRFECVVPILYVSNLRESLRFYEEVLGFGRDWGGDEAYPDYASVSRGGKGVMLSEGGQGNPGTWVWFGVDDARRLHEEFVARGAKIVRPLTNYPWALEFGVEDPDRHVLRFGSEAEQQELPR